LRVGFTERTAGSLELPEDERPFNPSRQSAFLLAVFSKRLDAQAKAAISESEKLEKQEALQVEIVRPKKEADELEVARQINQKTFRP